ncbi:MAG: RICIN domain-containing protein, partial [Eggerthellaceae bacterium]|nr:RICIN domain-containing protein [Eggerthellaceae bacterium]
GTDAQKWTLQRAKGGYVPEEVAPFELVPKLNEKLRLDVRGGEVGDCADVQVFDANGTVAQQWAVLDDGHGFWTLVNVNSGKALDVAYGGK